MQLTVSVAVCNPDASLWRRFVESLSRFLPEDSEVLIYDNGSDRKSNFQFNISKPIPVGYKLDDNNIGFGEAHNHNLRQAKGDYFLVLNDDVEFREPFIEKMMDVLEKNKDVMQVGMRRDTSNVLNPMGQGAMDEAKRLKGEFDYIEASCMMMRAIDAIRFGLFDARSFPFAYYEDADLSLRIRKAGYRIETVDCDWIHYRESTSKRLIEEGEVDVAGYKALNWEAFRRKWGGYLVSGRLDCSEHVVVRRTGGPGDVFLTTPIVKALKEEDPKRVITFLTKCKDVMSTCQYVDAVSTDCWTPLPCDRFIDLEHTYEKDFTMHIVDWYAKVANVKINSRLGIPSISRDDFAKVSKLLMANGLYSDRYAVIGAGDAWPGKKWATENYAVISKRLMESGWKVVTCGVSRDGFEIPCDADFVNALSLPQTLGVISKAKLFVGHEGTLGHLAQSSRIPTILLYGCTTPELTNETDDLLHPVVTKAVCRGCRHRGMFSGNGIQCPRGYECMKMISIGEVWRKIEEAAVRGVTSVINTAEVER